MASCSEGKSPGNALMATTGVTPWIWMFSICLRRLAPPRWTSSGFSSSMAGGNGRPATTRCPPEWTFSARTVLTTTAASGDKPEARHLMLKNRSAPMSAPKPASVMRKSPGVDPDEVGDDRGVAVGDVAERPGVHEHRGVLDRLEQVRLDGLTHDHRHRPGRLQVLGGHRLPVCRCTRRRSGRGELACRGARSTARGWPSPPTRR